MLGNSFEGRGQKQWWAGARYAIWSHATLAPPGPGRSTAEIALRQRVTMPACTANGSSTLVSARASTARPNSTAAADFNASISTSRIRPR